MATLSENTGDAFGTDILFTKRYQVTSKGDFQFVSGTENLRLSIIRRLVTSPGEYKLDPNYGVGLPQLVKKPLTTANLDSIKHRITDNLSRDPRIEKILSLSVTKIMLGDQTGVSVVLVIQAKGATMRFQPFNFTRGT